jgi:hypothetical protein
MDDAFEDRKKSQEAKYKLDEELRFKAVARRNKLLGLWAAGLLGETESAAEAYAKTVVMAGMDAAGDRAVVDRLVADFLDRGVAVSQAEIGAEMERLFAVAMEQLTADYPTALDRDHEQVGG